jgi:hypothetical protein
MEGRVGSADINQGTPGQIFQYGDISFEFKHFLQVALFSQMPQ